MESDMFEQFGSFVSRVETYWVILRLFLIYT